MKKRDIIREVEALRASLIAAKKHQDYLTARLEAMDTRVAALGTADAARDADYSVKPVALKRLTTRVNALNNRIDEVECLVTKVERRDSDAADSVLAAVFEQARIRVNAMLEATERRFEAVEAVKVEAERKSKVLDGMKERMERLNIPELGKNVAWLTERVNMLATRLEGMRGNVTLDDAAAQRLTFAVGQFAARLDRLEALPAPRPNGPSE